MRVFGVAGHSGMGKTTLLEKLIPEISSRGLIVSLIKHTPVPRTRNASQSVMRRQALKIGSFKVSYYVDILSTRITQTIVFSFFQRNSSDEFQNQPYINRLCPWS